MNQGTTIKEMYHEDRPYEKCERFGPENMTDAELIAVMLRSGTKGENSLQLAKRLLDSASGSKGLPGIHQWTLDSLLKIRGIGRVKAIQLLCICELSRRMAKAAAAEGLDFSSPQTIAQYYMEDMRHKEKEVLKMLLLNTRTRLIGESDVSIGTADMALVSPRELFREALQKNAVSIILLHNHPSGDPSPSREDIRITRRVFEAGMMIGIELLDHIVIGNNRFVSLRQKGLLQATGLERI